MSIDFSFSEKTIGFIVEGVFNKKAVRELRAQLLQKLETNDRINFYVEDNNIKKFTLAALFIAVLFPLRYSSRFDKIAVVTNRKWIRWLAGIDDYLTKGEIRYFTVANRLDAVTWIAKNATS